MEKFNVNNIVTFDDYMQALIKYVNKQLYVKRYKYQTEIVGVKAYYSYRFDDKNEGYRIILDLYVKNYRTNKPIKERLHKCNLILLGSNPFCTELGKLDIPDTTPLSVECFLFFNDLPKFIVHHQMQTYRLECILKEKECLLKNHSILSEDPKLAPFVKGYYTYVHEQYNK